jgi:hypothetical protein
MVYLNGWFRFDLAPFPNKDRWAEHRRCVAMLGSPTFSPCTAMGVYRSIPQAHPVVVLFSHGPDVEINEDLLCRQ